MVDSISRTVRVTVSVRCPRRPLPRDTDPGQLALALLAAVQGGLILAQAQHTTDALEAALDTVIGYICDHAAEPC